MSWGMPVRSETEPTSTPSAARNSRVPSVAKISTSRARRSRARAAIPSRFATDSRARNRVVLLPRDLPRSDALGSPAEYNAGHGILRHRRPAGSARLATRRGTPARRRSPGLIRTRIERAAAALGLPLHPIHGARVPGPLHPVVGGVAGDARDPRRPLQRPDTSASSPRPVPRPLGVAALDRNHAVRAAPRRGGLQLLPDRPARDPGDGPRRHGVGPLRPVPAPLRGLRAKARE